jgi:hypothetical protein
MLNADDRCSELEKDAQITIPQIMPSPEQVKKDLVGATKYLIWIRDKEGTNKVVKAKKSVMQEEVSVQQSAPMQAD